MVRPQDAQSVTLVDMVHRQLREKILLGEYESGERLKPAELCEAFGVSMSVVREVLKILAGEKLLTVSPHRGYHVVRVEADALKEIIEMRVICETGALRHAIERGDARWESEVIAAHHRMSRIEQDERQGSDEWFRAHREFHFALLAGCHNSHLLDLCSNLLDSADLYLRWTSSSLDDPESGSVLQGRDVAREHRDILDAVLQRNPDLAAALYTAHLELTGRLGIAALSSHSHPPLSPRAPKELPE